MFEKSNIDPEEARLKKKGFHKKTFTEESLSDKIKAQQKFDARFHTEAARNSALAVKSDHDEDRKQVELEYVQRNKIAKDAWDKVDWHKPQDGDFVKAMKEKMRKPEKIREASLARIARIEEGLFAQIEASQIKLKHHIGKVPVERRITYSKDQTPRFNAATRQGFPPGWEPPLSPQPAPKQEPPKQPKPATEQEPTIRQTAFKAAAHEAYYPTTFKAAANPGPKPSTAIPIKIDL